MPWTFTTVACNNVTLLSVLKIYIHGFITCTPSTLWDSPPSQDTFWDSATWGHVEIGSFVLAIVQYGEFICRVPSRAVMSAAVCHSHQQCCNEHRVRVSLYPRARVCLECILRSGFGGPRAGIVNWVGFVKLLSRVAFNLYCQQHRASSHFPHTRWPWYCPNFFVSVLLT